MPGLLFGVHHTPSSTSESVSILVNVDEQTNCDGVEGLTITATLTEGVIDTIVSTQQADSADGIITFRSVSAGDYTCSVTVEDETGPIESMQIPCGGTYIDFVPLAINPKAKTLSNIRTISSQITLSHLPLPQHFWVCQWVWSALYVSSLLVC